MPLFWIALAFAAGITAASRVSIPWPAWAGLYAFRQRLQANLLQIFPAPESGLLVGILLGEDSLIPGDLMQDFTDTSTAHIIAISG
jgi:predicted membrane metal-binding protein